MKVRASKAIICGLLLGACSQGPALELPVLERHASGQHYRIFYVAELRGELEPCGCTLEPLGGLARLASYLESRRQPGFIPLLIAHGDLISGVDVGESKLAQLQASGDFLQAQLVALGLNGAGDGPHDRVFALASGAMGERYIPPSGQRLVGEVQIYRSGALLKDVDPKRLAIMLFDGDLAEARKQAKELAQKGVDLLLLAEGDEASGLQDVGHGLLAVSGGERGQQVIEVDLVWRGDGSLQRYESAQQRRVDLAAMESRIEGLVRRRDRAKVRQKPAALIAARSQQIEKAKAARFELFSATLPQPPPTGNSIASQRVPLDSSISEDESMKTKVQAHHRSISILNKSLEKNRKCPPPPELGSAVYLGSQACRSCHSSAYDFWKKTPHAHAWATLQKKGRTYDYNCVSCHSAGFDEAEGFCRVSEAGDRINVGCENCHGPGSLHAASGDKTKIKRAVPAAVCTNCHHAPHTNTFVYSDRLSRIVGPGHGAP
jgi:hypothetical protein